MSNQYFRFKQFSIDQQHTAMKVGTDGVFVGAWADAVGSRILDVGTGTGLIALMMAQRCPEASVVGIEIEQSAYLEASANVERSPWASRVRVELGAFQEFAEAAADSPKFDHIISNPPYFRNAMPSPEAARTLARHTDSLTYHALFQGVESLLSVDGVFTVIFPHDCLAEVMAEATRVGLFCYRRADIVPREGRPPKRVAAAFSRQPIEPQIETVGINASSGVGYSEKYIAITRDFYL